MRWISLFLAGTVTLAVIVGAGSCGKLGRMQSKEKVQAAIEAHLRQRQNLLSANMTLEVQEVKFDGDTAQAEVRFRSKQSPDLVVAMRYVLRRTGDRWAVESSSMAAGMGHGSPASGNPQPSAPPSAAPVPQASH